MPYKSAKQRRFLHAVKPEVAAEFDADIRRMRAKKKALPPGVGGPVGYGVRGPKGSHA